jgi:hypothetical protein
MFEFLFNLKMRSAITWGGGRFAALLGGVAKAGLVTSNLRLVGKLFIPTEVFLFFSIND